MWTSEDPDFLEFLEIRNSEFPRFPSNPEIRIFRISANPDIRIFRISGKSGNPDFVDFRIIRITVTALIVLGIISNAVTHYSYSINCFRHY